MIHHMHRICLLLLDSRRLAKKIFEYSFYLEKKQEPMKGIFSSKKNNTRMGWGGSEWG